MTKLKWYAKPIRHCEPSASCHSERSEESHTVQGKLRVAIFFALALGWE